MPLHIGRVDAEMDVRPRSDPSSSNPTVGGPAPGGSGAASSNLKEHLRPIVVEILNEELERLRRRQG